MFYTYYEIYRFRETLPSYPLTMLFSYMLVCFTWSRSASSKKFAGLNPATVHCPPIVY